MRQILGIDVSDDLFRQWRGWFAPGYQLFRSTGLSTAARAHVDEVDPMQLPMEVRDTFGAYSAGWCRIDETRFRSAPETVRAELEATRDADEADLFRWPYELTTEGDAPVIAYVEDGTLPSRHREVPAHVWEGVRDVLPEARRLAGTFPEKSGPNCFGNVLAAAGLPVQEDWVQQPQFEEFLAARAEGDPEADTGQPGVVMVWRQPDGVAYHACVTLGDGWVLNKAAQAWWAARYVWTVDEVCSQHDEPHLTRTTYRIRWAPCPTLSSP